MQAKKKKLQEKPQGKMSLQEFFDTQALEPVY
jgi:hypothetical protein